MAASFLTVLGSAETVRWVFSQERMAFSKHIGEGIASHVSRGDRLYFYVTSKCWPGLGGTRPSSGVLVSDAVVLTDVKSLPRKIVISGRSFSYGCELLFERLTSLGSGVSLAEMAGQLDLLAGKHNYGQALQRTPVRLTPKDAELLNLKLDTLAVPFENAVDSYLGQAV